jgi:hypothetical protein
MVYKRLRLVLFCKEAISTHISTFYLAAKNSDEQPASVLMPAVSHGKIKSDRHMV